MLLHEVHNCLVCNLYLTLSDCAPDALDTYGLWRVFRAFTTNATSGLVRHGCVVLSLVIDTHVATVTTHATSYCLGVDGLAFGLLFADALLVHLLDEHIDIVTHSFQIFTE